MWRNINTLDNKFIFCFRREQQSTGYKQYKKRFVRPLLKAQEKLYRKQNGIVRFSTSSTPTTPPSPTDSPQNPVKATMYTQLNESNQPETVLASSNSYKRKYRHRRVGSGCGLSSSPRSSPHRERKVRFDIRCFCGVLQEFLKMIFGFKLR